MKKLNIKLSQLVLFAIIGVAAFGGVSSYLSRGHVEFMPAMSYVAGRKNTQNDSENNGSQKNVTVNLSENSTSKQSSKIESFDAGISELIPDVSENSNPESIEIDVFSNDTEMNHSKEAIINGKVNLNAASLEQLQIAPGIGPAKAQKIIDYREEYGGFSCVEELTEISGIGEKTLAKIRDYYCAE